MQYDKYYLETNALRQLSKYLKTLKHNSFTSALSILELISGIIGKEYELRRTVVKNIINSEIPINWNLPESIQAKAFPLVEFEDFRIEGLKAICNILTKNDNKLKALELIESLDFNIKYFSNLDANYSKQFIDATITGNQNLKDTLNQTSDSILYSLSKDFIKNLPQYRMVNESITRYAISIKLAEASHLDQEKDIEELYNSYDGSINIFISSFSKFTAMKGATRSIPAKNDFIDLHHLMYLGSDSKYVIVTDDKMIKDINPQTVKINDFRKSFL